MNDRSKTGLQILQVGLGLGLLGDILLRQMPWGLNVLLFNLAFVAGMILLLWRHKREYLTLQTWALLGAQVFFASMFVWRDAPELRFADSVTIVAVLSVLFVPKFKVPARLAGAFHYIAGFFMSAVNAFFGGFALLFADIKWDGTNRSAWGRNAAAVLRGVLIVTPLILIFGGLFIAADAAYQGLVERVFNIDPATIFSHVFVFTFFGWLSAGYLRAIMFGLDPSPVNTTGGNTSGREGASDASDTSGSKVDNLRNDSGEHPVSLSGSLSILEHINRSDPPEAEAETRPVGSVPNSDSSSGEKKSTFSWANIDNSLFPSAVTLGSVEVGVILGLMNLLFLSFVIVQIPYLFGGMDLVQNTPDFKLAEYARRGFGELVAVSALVLPVLLVGHWLIKKESPVTEKLFRVLASIQLVLLFVIMASAVQRLVLLTGNLGYGMTTVRLYPMIFMSWLAIVFVWFALTVLRGYRRYFAWGALWSAFFVLGATHFLNPDKFIVQTNIALMKQGREFDARYNSELSDDATASVLSVLPMLSEEDQCQVKWALHRRLIQYEGNDLRSWNLDRSNAHRLLAEQHSILDDHLNCPPVMPFDENREER